MRDAIGGTVNLVIIVVFLVIVSGYMAFNVSYMKAFKVKNKIISTFEEFDGNCSGDSNQCNQIIKQMMDEVGYNASDMSKVQAKQYACGTNNENCSYDRYTVHEPVCPLGNKYCYVEFEENDKTGSQKYHYFKIYTRVTMDIPIFNKIMSGFRFFQVSGDTKRMPIQKK